jgi:hypothetical protein
MRKSGAVTNDVSQYWTQTAQMQMSARGQPLFLGCTHRKIAMPTRPCARKAVIPIPQARERLLVCRGFCARRCVYGK